MLQQLPNLASDMILYMIIRPFSEDRCLNRCSVSFAKSRVEDCLELNFKYYQTLAHLSYSSYVCWTSAHATRVRFVSVRASISSSICKFDEVLYNCVIYACDKFLAAELAEIMKLCML